MAVEAEFEADLNPSPHPRGVGRRKGEGPTARQEAQAHARQEARLVFLARAGEHTTLELAELFNVGRSTVYRAIQRAGGLHPTAVTKG